jgi:serine/threonine protein kinase/ABC-type branched-subunit amino acid transport system substrate-binding protein
MKCPYCGTDNPPGEEFCVNCGGALNVVPPAGTSIPANPGAPNVAILSSTGNTIPGGVTVGGGPSGGYRTLAPNSQLQNGRYVVEKVLGQGGMGAAMLVKDTRVSNKLVVIKELISDSTDPQQRQADVNNFKREVDTLVQIDHPLVPTVTDSFQEHSRYFMVQEYVAGENLEDHMERIKRPMPEREALTYASQVLDILDYLSQLKPPIVHRDIKPANIIIGAKDKRAHLVDFGIARADEAKNAKRKQTAALGTPGYAPPEQYQGNADSRADIYALAATLHHLLTNRDPREYPPFIYPPARSINKGLTADSERVLEHALQINVNNRYQKAADMKRDIDEILAEHFSVSGDTSTYILGNSGPMTTPRPRSGPQSSPRTPVPPNPPTPIPINRSGPVPYGSQSQRQAPYPPPQSGAYGGRPAQQKQRGNNHILFSFLLLLLVVIIIAVGFFVIPNLTKKSTPTGSTGSNTPAATATAAPSTKIPVASNGIGTTTVNGQLIGISDGSSTFDTNRIDGSLKKQAATDLTSGNISGAETLWRSASGEDSSDAEPLIYLENQRVKTSGSPYITFIVGTILTGVSADVQVGRDSLQGAYLAQKEFNTQNAGGIQARLLIANSGADANNVTAVANQIVQAAAKDPTIVGVMGWPYSGLAQDAIAILGPAKIPMVSSTASSDALTGISPYFFRVAPPDKSQSAVGVHYAQTTLHAKNVAVFVDNSDSYSQSLGTGFSQQFSGGTVNTVNYTRGDATSISTALQKALSNKPVPDLIYFAGYSDDVSILLKDLPASNPIAVLGGDALYNLGGYPAGTPGLTRLHFTAFAYPDEWSILGYASKKPAFFTDYPNTYGKGPNHSGGPYGYTRAGYNVVLSFDATLALLDASKNALGTQTTGLTPDKLKTALSNIKGAKAIQGVSGQISFGPDGNPMNKAVVTMHVAKGGNQMDPQLGAGTFLVG